MALPQGHFGYQNVHIITTSSLGVGSYGAVYRAQCDQLPCAAKIIHPTLFGTNDPGVRKIVERFEQECQFLSSVRHPHIVQYLGVSRDPESGLPVLLMELMDSSLTRFLDQSQEPLPFCIQVDICHNVALAITYLHLNSIIHRDLSSNNVLLIGPGNRAKVTDFGMSKLADANPRMTPMTMCPGTLAYMPPEALKDPPVYSKKLDCFSFGVLGVQIMTRQFPDPGVRFRTIDITDPRIPSGTVDVPVPEVERRQSHIHQIDRAHPLLPVALNCLKDRDRERPSAQELCHLLAALKEAPQYGESVQQATTDGESVQIRELRAEAQREMEQLQQQHSQHIENLQQQLQDKNNTIEGKHRVIASMERQLRQLNQQLEANEQVTADFQQKHLESEKKIRDLCRSLAAKDQQVRELQQPTRDQPTAKLQVRGQSARKGPLSLHWRNCGKAPCAMTSSLPVVDGNMAYFIQHRHNDVFSYDSEKQTWSTLPKCPYTHSSLAVVNGLLTAIGGRLHGDTTNQLFSLTAERQWMVFGWTSEKKWVEHFPPMPTKHSGTAAVCSGKSLVVAGGFTEKCKLDTVEVMNTETLQWSTASSLPFPLVYASATVCQDRVYLMGYDASAKPRSVLTCSMADLLQSSQSQSLEAHLKTLTLQAVWNQVADLPVRSSSCATLCGQLLAVGGCDNSFRNRSNAIHQYDPATDSWEVISHMPTARSNALAAVLPGNKLMVVGGQMGTLAAVLPGNRLMVVGGQMGTVTDIVEIATSRMECA